jgi:deazaflavin-dependent oxidoreductase (nitroreductase family)
MRQPSYLMPRATIAVPNLGRVLKPPRPGSPLWQLLNVYSNINVLLYRLTGGRVGGRMGRAPVLLLHHVGRKSEIARVTPVLFLADGTRLVIVGSKGGASKHPAWFGNLMAHPNTTVEVARRRIPVRARLASETEHAEYWPRLVEMYPSYSVYQERTDRSLPIVLLEWTHTRD